MALRQVFTQFVQGTGGTNFSVVKRPALALRTVLKALTAQTPGLAASMAPATLAGTAQTPGLTLAAPVVDGDVAASTPPGVKLSAVGSMSGTQDVPAFDVVRVTYDLTAERGSNGAASTGTWTNASNATGTSNGTVAQNKNTITQAASGTLTLSYAAPLDKTSLTIQSVTLRKFWSNSVGLTAPGAASLAYSTDGGTTWTNLLVNYTASFSDGGVPVDLTAAIGGDWSKLANFKVRVTYSCNASATPSTLSVDAFHLLVTATRTDTV